MGAGSHVLPTSQWTGGAGGKLSATNQSSASPRGVPLGSTCSGAALVHALCCGDPCVSPAAPCHGADAASCSRRCGVISDGSTQGRSSHGDRQPGQGRMFCPLSSFLLQSGTQPKSPRSNGTASRGESAEDKSGLVSPPGAVPLCPGDGSHPSLSPYPLTMGLSLCPSPPKHVPTAAHQAVVSPLTSPTGGDARGGALCEEQPSPGQSRMGALL